MTRKRRLTAGALVLTLISLAGCTFVADGFEPELNGGAAWRQIRGQLVAQESQPTATVKLSKVHGKWSKVLIVCRGVSVTQISKALGYSWTGPAPDDAAYGYIIFADSKKVEQYYVGHSDQDENFVDHWTFSVCPVTPGFEISAPIELPRTSDPSIVLEKQESPEPSSEVWWEMTATQIAELESLSSDKG